MKTVRLLFSKTERAKYISHLDLNRTVIRAVRRAHIPIWYTEGFNRHPYITFAAPLSLGFESVGEILELRLTAEIPLFEVTERLNAVLPAGLHISETFEAVKKVRELAFARYRMDIALPADTVQAFLSQPEILVEKRTKKKELKTIDIRPAFADATVEPTANGCQITVTLPCGSENTVNPTLLLTALEKQSGTVQTQVMREALLDKEGQVFR